MQHKAVVDRCNEQIHNLKQVIHKQEEDLREVLISKQQIIERADEDYSGVQTENVRIKTELSKAH